jgi:hypothetical protein
MNPAGRVRCNIKSIANGYSRAFQSFLDCTPHALGYRQAVLEDWFSLERFFPQST